MAFEHKSVLLEEVIENLNINPEGTYVDGTAGGGGHSYRIAEKLSTGRLVCIDQDEEAVKAASIKLEPLGERSIVIRSNYSEIEDILLRLSIRSVDGILLDLGVSSYQLDTPERGFSYMEDAPLDMRMDNRFARTARDIVNNYSEAELFRIIRDYGEDNFARNIAKHIIRLRQDKPIETTFELNEAIKAAIPARIRASSGHPSKRTFQAIRIELNRELEVLKNTLQTMIGLLKPGGRLCIITFHSLEDRIVKTCFKSNENPCICPPDFPVCACHRKPTGRLITKKPILPSARELEYNTRSKSAKLRVFEKVRPTDN